MVKRLRHRPFTAVTRVRFPVGSPPIKYALVAELADAPDLGSGGRPWGFESLQAHQLRLVVLLQVFFIGSALAEDSPSDSEVNQ